CQFVPAVVEFDVVADLDTEFAEIAVEYRNPTPRRASVLESGTSGWNDQVHLAVDTRDFALSPEQYRCIRHAAPALLKVGWRHDVAPMLARLRGEDFPELAFQRNRPQATFARRFSRHRHLGQDRYIEPPAVV